jgi:hypothetical protein
VKISILAKIMTTMMMMMMMKCKNHCKLWMEGTGKEATITYSCVMETAKQLGLAEPFTENRV